MYSVPVSTRSVARDREAYFTAAWQLLAEKGPSGVTVAGLCAHLGATKGSFYHHFADMPDFVEAFSARYRDWMVERFGRYLREPDPVRRLEAMANTSFTDMAPGQGAFRAWARTNPAVAAAMPAVHHSARISAVGVLTEFTEDEYTGYVLADMALSICVGLQLRPVVQHAERFLHTMALSCDAIGFDYELVHRPGRSHLRLVSLQRLLPLADAVQPTVDSTVRDRPAAIGESARHRSGSRQLYYAAARNLLAERGPNAVTIANLAQQLQVTSGSFQYQFGSFPRFLQQLAADWTSREMARTDQAAAEPDPRRRLERLLSDLLLLPPGPTETAWQSWGHSNPLVAAALQQVQEHRRRVIAMTLNQIRQRPQNQLLADSTLALALGLHRWHPPHTRAHTSCIAREWIRRGLRIDTQLTFESGTPRLLIGAA
jgi:AcrR family transcriptional regulator